ncbi:carbamoyltransferase C-terminal domain-containing protein [Pectobacterium actinidiae]|uniref:carbamoyltransferase family protein n=1 Tax=Pectobacterium actinidiae TaxID=1507808 RepID=UPI0024A245EF|nr:carbamoyltransferase C-terminal domain-containing protein [Pectobacterium actinidiae]MDY4314604.1 carbamoyltransferase C-terminal domain-containing protein [Pectobacterium actinidiae]GLW36640.1 carbamoyltransferase [Pectobacterium carotovorum subsp. carotovorum]
MYILGINSVYHESSVCLIKDGEVVFAIEEERLNRQKHGKSADLDNPDELPLSSLNAALAFAGIQLCDVHSIGYSIDPIARHKSAYINETKLSDGWASESGEGLFYRKTANVPLILQNMGFRGDFHWVAHHTAHAASAYYPSSFNESLVLSLDGIGEDNTAGVFIGKENKLTKISTITYPNSIGFMWERISEYLGFSEYDACKVMGMAAYGDAERFKEQFSSIVECLPEGQFTINNDILTFRSKSFSKLESLFDLQKRHKHDELRQEHYDIAATLQVVTDDIVMNIARHYLASSGSHHLCLAGGVALNCITNRLLYEACDIADIYVQPAAHDAGTAIGAALYIWHHIMEQTQRHPMVSAYLGPEYSDMQYEHELKKYNLTWEKVDNIHQRVASLIADNNVVAWFQGRMEFGPRALGNRSLLADPRNKDIRDLMNLKVKHREFFRPFAPSVLREYASDWFISRGLPDAAKYMLLAMDVKPAKQNAIPAVTHADGTARVQIVDKETNESYTHLISEFHKLTGVPILLNTSFNDSEPIVCSPEDAIKTFLKTRIDFLVLGDYIIKSIH